MARERAVSKGETHEDPSGHVLVQGTARPRCHTNFIHNSQSVSQLFHGPAPRSPLHRLAVKLRHSRSNTSTEYSLPGATQLSQVRSVSPSGHSQQVHSGTTLHAHHTRFILMLATCNTYRAHRHRSESPYPGSTPGLNPCNHLAWLACGPWRTHKHNTYIQPRRLWQHEGLRFPRNQRATRRRTEGW